jgi:hypothetical protein
MEPTVEMGYTGWNLLKSRASSDGIIMLPSIGLPLDVANREMVYAGWNL